MTTLKKTLCAFALGGALLSGQTARADDWNMQSIGAVLLGFGAPAGISKAIEAAGLEQGLGKACALAIGAMATVATVEMLLFPSTEETTEKGRNKKHRRIKNDVAKVGVSTAAYYLVNNSIALSLCKESPYSRFLLPAVPSNMQLEDALRFTTALLTLYKVAMFNDFFIDSTVE